MSTHCKLRMCEHSAYRMSTHCKHRMCEHSGYRIFTHCKHTMFTQHHLHISHFLNLINRQFQGKQKFALKTFYKNIFILCNTLNIVAFMLGITLHWYSARQLKTRQPIYLKQHTEFLSNV